MEDEGEISTPFWIQSTPTRRHVISGVFLIFLCIIISFLFIIIFFIPPLIFLSNQIFKPNLIKKSWDYINITIVLLALIFGFWSRNRNHDPTVEFDPTDGIGLRGNRYHDPNVDDDRIDGKIGEEVRKSNESGQSGWYEYSDPTAEVDLSGNRNHDPTVDDDLTSSKIVNEVKKSNLSVNDGWCEHPDRMAEIDFRESRNHHPTIDDDWTNGKTGNGKSNELRSDYWNRTAEVDLSRNQNHDQNVEFDDKTDGMMRNEVLKSKESIYIDETSKGEVKSAYTGIVLGVGNGVARVCGLGKVTAGEIVEFDEGTIGIVMNSDSSDNVGVVFMGEGLLIREGSYVKATGKVAQEPGLGRVMDVLAKPIDGINKVSDSEIKEMPLGVRRRMRLTAESIGNKGKSSDEVSGLEPLVGKLSHRRTKSSGLEPSGEKSSHRKTKSSGFERFGTVLLVGNGIARIYGLDEVTAGEIVEFEEGTVGIVMDLASVNNVGVVLMGDGLLIQEGSRVKATGKIAQMPVAEDRLGSVISSLIDGKSEIYGSESRVSEEKEINVRRRTRRKADKGKSSEDVIGSGRPDQLSNRKTKRTHEESITITPKLEANDELESKEYESSQEMLVQDVPSERKRGAGNATRDFLMSLTKRKKKQGQKSVENFENYDTSLESQPPSPPPTSKGFFSSKKGKGNKVTTAAPPSPPLYTASWEQKSTPVTAPASTSRPPLPVKIRGYAKERESLFAGAESPLHPIPSPPPPPPFKMSSWKFVVNGDYVKIGSMNSSRNSSRSVSPEPEEVESLMGSESGVSDMAMGTMFCPSPDVNSKADMFIAKFRAGLKLQKMNSLKQKQGVGLSNLGPALDQAQA